LALLGGSAQVRGSTQGVLRCGEGRSHGLMESLQVASQLVDPFGSHHCDL
jgi:hypothetical protein